VRTDLLSYVEWVLRLCACIRLTKDNKEEQEELVDVAPHWGEPRISCVMVACVGLLRRGVNQ
jgi:hypothetical protein